MATRPCADWSFVALESGEVFEESWPNHRKENFIPLVFFASVEILLDILAGN